MSLLDQIFMMFLAIYFCVGFVACIALYEIRSGKVSAEEMNKSNEWIEQIKSMDRSVYLMVFFLWGLSIFAPKGE